ncbi:hypothetical protein JCM9279_007176 [Rhodotorula babjevae]
MHSHSPSHSYRIPVSASPAHPSPSSSSTSPSSNRLRSSSGSPSSDYLSRPRARRSSSGTHRAHHSPLRTAYDHAATWLTARVVGRTGLRRWMLVVALGLGAALYLTRSGAPAPWTARKGSPDRRVAVSPEGVPVVDRSTLDKLRLLEIHLGADEDDPAIDPVDEHRDVRSTARKGPGGTHHDLDRPPLVVAIPDYVKPDPSAPVSPDKVPADLLDYDVCGATDGRPCQFLIPAWLGEQETKAQQHLYQLGLLALALNRTLVLPNVSKSRLGTCYKNPFAFYYSESSLSDLGIRTISQADFVAWTHRRDRQPSAQVVTMANAKAGYPHGAVEIDSASDPTLVPSKPTRNLCLRAPRTRLDFAGHSPLAMYPPEGYHKSEAGRLGFGESVINTLRSHEVGSRSSRASSSRLAAFALPDVLAFNYELRFPIMSPAVAAQLAPSSSSSSSPLDDPAPVPLPFAHFPYAETWISLASFAAARLSPFVAIHWRTETLTPGNLAPCASSLLAKLAALKRRHPSLRHVYLATDYPIEQLDPSLAPSVDPGTQVAHSGTFAKSVTEQHHVAMRRFLRDFKRTFAPGRGSATGPQLELTTFSKEQAALAQGAADGATLPARLAAQLANLTSPLLPSSSSPSLPSSDLDDPVAVAARARAALVSLGTLDSGLYGILDKLVAAQAELFLTGVPGAGSSTVGACAKLSSFTTQLVGAREALWEEQGEAGPGAGEGPSAVDEQGELLPGRLWNTVAHFSLSGKEVD